MGLYEDCSAEEGGRRRRVLKTVAQRLRGRVAQKRETSINKPQAMMTAKETPMACAADEPTRRNEWPVHLAPGGVGMLSELLHQEK